MRKFVLKDASGHSYDLFEKDNFFHEPKGLGFSTDNEMLTVNNRTIILNKKYEYGEVKGEIFFKSPNAYQHYYDFVRFCTNDPLYLEYTPFDTFTAKCTVTNMSKGELSMGSVGLSCEITLSLLSLWYKSVSKYNSGSVSGGKTYSYEYDYTYSDDIAMSISVQSDSYVDSPCKLEIYGPITNPTWAHLVNSVQEATGSYTGTVPSNHKLVIDTTVFPYSIQELDFANQLIADRYSLCDFSTDRFLFMQYGNNRVTVGADSVNSVPIGLEVQLSYASV